jgi:CheY-like chemotaxis protein
MATSGPLPLDEEVQRLEFLQALELLDTPPEDCFDGICRLAVHRLRAPIALIPFIDARRLWFKSRIGLNIHETMREASFCNHTLLYQDTLVIPDTLLDPRFRNNPFVREAPFIRFYAGHPFKDPMEHPLGTLCILDTVPRTMAQGDIEQLRHLTKLIEMEIRHRALFKGLIASSTYKLKEKKSTTAAVSSLYPHPEQKNTFQSEMPYTRSQHILLIDDVEDNRKLFSMLLSRYGYSVVTAQNVEEALRLILQEHPDLILTDLHLGESEADGLMLAHELKNTSALQHIPVIAITSYKDVYNAEQASLAGCIEYYPLPMNLTLLVLKVKQTLDRYQPGTTGGSQLWPPI